MKLRILWLLLVAGCAGPSEHVVRRALEDHPRPTVDTPEPTTLSGLAACVAAAVSRSPAARAAFESWRANVAAVTRSRTLPEPELSFAYYLRSVETRVGPQRARIGLKQTLPWPQALSRASERDSEAANASAQAFEAEVLQIRQRVAEHYWRLWETRATIELHVEHAALLEGIAATVLARIETGRATVSEQQQIELILDRLRDRTESLRAEATVHLSALRSVIGLEGPATVTTPEPPSVRGTLPELSELTDLATRHPRVKQNLALARSADAEAERSRTQRLPRMTFGVDWIVTGEATVPGVPDSGQDAVVGGLGLSLPVWRGTYSDDIERAEANARMYRARADATRMSLRAAVEDAWSRSSDSSRRVSLYRETLIPRARAAHQSVLGAYSSGRADLAQALISQETLLELRLEIEGIRGSHARAIATLEALIGRGLEGSAP